MLGIGIPAGDTVFLNFHERAPGRDFFDVLHGHDARAGALGPAEHDEDESADALVERLAALGLTEVLAVGREVREADRAAFGDGEGIDIENVLAVVHRLRVVDAVHAEGLGAVVDGVVHVTAEGEFDAGGSAAPAGEVVDDEFAVLEIEGELRADHGCRGDDNDCRLIPERQARVGIETGVAAEGAGDGGAVAESVADDTPEDGAAVT